MHIEVVGPAAAVPQPYQEPQAGHQGRRESQDHCRQVGSGTGTESTPEIGESRAVIALDAGAFADQTHQNKIYSLHDPDVQCLSKGN